MKWRELLLAFTFIHAIHQSAASLVDTSFEIGTGADGLVEQVLELKDGKILVCGSFTSFNGKNRSYIARLNADGSVDMSFDAHPGYWVRHMAVQADDKIVIGGYFTTVDDVPRNLIARLNPNGTLDSTFDPGSGASDIIAGGIDGNNTPFVFWLDIQTDGKIIITGNFRKYNGEPSTGIARLNADGTRDTTFTIDPGLDSWGRVIKLSTTGQIYVGGWFTSYNGFSANRLVRINPDGTPDRNFKPFYGDLTAVYSIVELADGKLITSGHSKNTEGLFHENVVRLNTDGSVDRTWRGATNEKTESLLLLENGELLLGGYFNEINGAARVGIGRLHEDGSLDEKFVAVIDNFVWTIASARNDKVLISGGFTTIDGVTCSRVARLHVPESSPPSPRPPTMTNALLVDGTFRVTVQTTPGRTYVLESSDSPSGNWSALASKEALENSLDFEDPTVATRKFFRVLVR